MGNSIPPPFSPFDFGNWRRLAQADPDRFELLRRNALAGFIESRTDTRLEGFQRGIDQERGRAGTPLLACVAIAEMLRNKVGDLQGALDSIDTEDGSHGGSTATGSAQHGGATILPFRRP